MTEVEWPAETDPTPMLTVLQDGPGERKLRLFSVACCRRIIRLLSGPEFVRAVETAELCADGRVSRETCHAASDRAYGLYESVSPRLRTSADLATYWASMVEHPGYSWRSAVIVSENSRRLGKEWARGVPLNDKQLIEQNRQTAVLRDVFGNPFRPAPVDPSWLTFTVTALARQMYDARDFSAMPILADALQDAGCADDQILGHCRGPEPHVRGCWVIDECLLKSQGL